ncbi:hypothetical protein [Moraxella lacunata]|uniref:hypothetical protein n=1 Tax=Moraxella lacunata TaxID=477 RepID=UPI003EE3F3B5
MPPSQGAWAWSGSKDAFWCLCLPIKSWLGLSWFAFYKYTLFSTLCKRLLYQGRIAIRPYTQKWLLNNQQITILS